MKLTIEQDNIKATIEVENANAEETVEAFKAAMIAVGYSMDRFAYTLQNPTLEDRIKEHRYDDGPLNLAADLNRDLVVVPGVDLLK